MKEKLNADKTLELLIGVIKENLGELYCPNPFGQYSLAITEGKVAFEIELAVTQ